MHTRTRRTPAGCKSVGWGHGFGSWGGGKEKRGQGSPLVCRFSTNTREDAAVCVCFDRNCLSVTPRLEEGAAPLIASVLEPRGSGPRHAFLF